MNATRRNLASQAVNACAGDFQLLERFMCHALADAIGDEVQRLERERDRRPSTWSQRRLRLVQRLRAKGLTERELAVFFDLSPRRMRMVIDEADALPAREACRHPFARTITGDIVHDDDCDRIAVDWHCPACGHVWSTFEPLEQRAAA